MRHQRIIRRLHRAQPRYDERYDLSVCRFYEGVGERHLRLWERSTRVWDGATALSFAVSACFVCWAFCFAGVLGPDFTITIHPLQFAIDTESILLTAAAFIPALYCFVKYPECRSSLRKFDAGWNVYFIAIGVGMLLPFTSYLGTRHPEFPWGSEAASDIVRLFAWNLLLAPLWEEIVWRGCFLNKVRSFSAPSSGILLMSIGFTIWHGAKMAIFYRSGMPIAVLAVLPFLYFCLGVILGSVFEMGRGSLWPCVLLHSAFNAATDVYAGSYDRASELGSYVAELVVAALAAGFLFRSAIRQSRASS
jgi:membrane protease YdiL (CAAX protease family)